MQTWNRRSAWPSAARARPLPLAAALGSDANSCTAKHTVLVSNEQDRSCSTSSAACDRKCALAKPRSSTHRLRSMSAT